MPRLVRKETKEIEPLLLKIPKPRACSTCRTVHIDHLAEKKLSKGLARQRRSDHAGERAQAG